MHFHFDLNLLYILNLSFIIDLLMQHIIDQFFLDLLFIFFLNLLLSNNIRLTLIRFLQFLTICQPNVINNPITMVINPIKIVIIDSTFNIIITSIFTNIFKPTTNPNPIVLTFIFDQLHFPTIVIDLIIIFEIILKQSRLALTFLLFPFTPLIPLIIVLHLLVLQQIIEHSSSLFLLVHLRSRCIEEKLFIFLLLAVLADLSQLFVLFFQILFNLRRQIQIIPAMTLLQIQSIVVDDIVISLRSSFVNNPTTFFTFHHILNNLLILSENLLLLLITFNDIVQLFYQNHLVLALLLV